MISKVAVVGMSPEQTQAPFDSDWEMFGLARDPEFWCRFDVCFEMHDLDKHHAYKDGQHDKRLTEIGSGLYVQKPNVRVPEAREFPLKFVTLALGRDWYQSSIAYMLGLAILEEPDEIGLWGVSDDVEYAYQRENLSWILGVAEGKGIQVTLPDDSPLLKYRNYGGIKMDLEYPVRYGWEG